MRVRRRWIAVALAAAVVFWQWPAVAGLLSKGRALLDPAPPNPSAWKIAKVPDALISEVYQLDAEQWLTFDLPPGHAVLRLLTTADLPEGRRAELPTPLPDTTNWTYAIRYQLLDAHGAALADREYHFQTRLSEIADPKTGATITPAFYLGEPLTPADTRLAVIALTGLPSPATRLRVRMLTVSDPLAGVAVRVLHPDPLDESKLRYAWQRTLPDKQRRLALGNIYPPDLLTEDERRNLFRHRWGPIAPRGRPGADFQQRELYILTEVEGEPARDRPPPSGTLAGPGRRAVIALPETTGMTRFVFTPVRHDGSTTSGRITVRWYGVGLTQRETFDVPWSGGEAAVERMLSGGTVEVDAPEAVAVRAFRAGSPSADRRRPANADEITPLPTQAWAYLLRGDAPVEFDVLHAADEATPIRVDVRRLATEPDTLRTGRATGPVALPPATARYQFLDQDGVVVQEGELVSDLPWSVYDRASLLRQEFGVSEPSAYHFAAPPQAVRLRFPATDAPLVVTISNRPGALVNSTQVPEDYLRFNRADVRQRNWFPLRSPKHDRLELANRVPVLTVQSRPPEDDPEIAAGRFEWQQFLPGGDWRGRHLLVLRDPAVPFRDEALPVTFRELTLDEETDVVFRAEPGRAETRPAIVYMRAAEDTFTLSVWIAGRLHHTERVDGSRGEVMLPAVALGARTVRVTSSASARVFVNCVDPGTGPALVKRMAVQLAGKPMTFDYEKTARVRQAGADDLLSFVLHRPAGATERVRFHVRIEAAVEAAVGPFPTWTFRDRDFDLRPGDGEAVPVLGTRTLRVDPGRVFRFPIGADLPAGKYRVRVEPVNDFEGYLLFDRSIPGAYDRREFFHEHPGRTVEVSGGHKP